MERPVLWLNSVAREYFFETFIEAVYILLIRIVIGPGKKIHFVTSILLHRRKQLRGAIIYPFQRKHSQPSPTKPSSVASLAILWSIP